MNVSASLASLLPWDDVRVIAGSTDIEITHVSIDSRRLQSGALFIALPGQSTHGLDHLDQALAAGTVALAVLPGDCQSRIDAPFNTAVTLVEVPHLDRRAGEIAALLFRHPADALTLIAVTGTDGKSSICRYVADALSASGTRCGYIGTLGWGMHAPWQDTGLTTPDAVLMQFILASLRDQGAAAVAIEASSHALVGGRLESLPIAVAVLSNLGRDHLDFHGSMENYRAAKARLFAWPTLQAMVVNHDDDFGRELAEGSMERADTLSCCVQYGQGEPGGDCRATRRIRLRAQDVVLHESGLSFLLVDEEARRVEHQRIDSPLLGRFNIDNLLACHGVLRALGHAANDAVHALSAVRGVSGRMESIRAAGRPLAIVDYAHNAHALEAALAATREHVRGRLWVVFGAGGDRDRGKRALMGQAAERAADVVIVTDDNPRSEDPALIRAAIIAGMNSPESVIEIGDRARAIDYALSHADAHDVVLIAGKGHEDYQQIGTKKFHFSDQQTVEQIFGAAI